MSHERGYIRLENTDLHIKDLKLKNSLTSSFIKRSKKCLVYA